MHRIELSVVALIASADEAHLLARELGEACDGYGGDGRVEYKVQGAAYAYPDAMPANFDELQSATLDTLDFTRRGLEEAQRAGLSARDFEGFEPSYASGFGVDDVKRVAAAREG